MIKPTYWLLRNLKLFFFVPVAVVFIYLPFMAICLYKTYSVAMYMYFGAMYRQFQLFIPLFSVWWTIFTLKEFMDNDGNELLYMYHKPFDILRIQMIVYSLYSLQVIIFMLIFNLFFGKHYFATAQLLISSFTMCAFAYFISFALNSTGIAFLFSIAYAISLNVIDLDRHLALISIFPESKEITPQNLVHLLLVFIASIILYVGGFLISKIKVSYK